VTHLNTAPLFAKVANNRFGLESGRPRLSRSADNNATVTTL